jgi:hypothetical protein
VSWATFISLFGLAPLLLAAAVYRVRVDRAARNTLVAAALLLAVSACCSDIQAVVDTPGAARAWLVIGGVFQLAGLLAEVFAFLRLATSQADARVRPAEPLDEPPDDLDVRVRS